MPSFLVHRDSYLMTREINLDQTTDAPVMDGLVNRCIAAACDALRSPTSVFTDFQLGHLGNIFTSMRRTHESIRELLRRENKSPHSVDAVPLARLQLDAIRHLFGFGRAFVPCSLPQARVETYLHPAPVDAGRV